MAVFYKSDNYSGPSLDSRILSTFDLDQLAIAIILLIILIL
ncbi:hypothetical protein HBNXNv_0658 [Candidatus Nanohalovita haloferacivicina]|nr:hypothetical protein HBNXNv_0658 [Candidatus Nanohalobia archaeon BNXNv]